MNIDAIQNGVVIDHIKAGSGMKLCSLLGLDSTDLSVAIIRNVNSRKMGKKHVFRLADRAKREYRCIYCETRAG